MPLFNHGSSQLHSGTHSTFLINTEALWDRDLQALAALVAPALRPFKTVYGIPRGGVRFAEALQPYTTFNGPRLVVDDVMTTGQSFLDVWEEGDKGVCIWQRGKPMDGVLAIFTLDESLRGLKV